MMLEELDVNTSAWEIYWRFGEKEVSEVGWNPWVPILWQTVPWTNAIVDVIDSQILDSAKNDLIRKYFYQYDDLYAAIWKFTTSCL